MRGLFRGYRLRCRDRLGLSPAPGRRDMSATLEKLRQWTEGKENEHLEFKEAKNHCDFEELVRYCAAFANEGGGTMILGVTDKLPHRVVGSQAFKDLERAKHGLIERLRLRIDAEALEHPKGIVGIAHTL